MYENRVFIKEKQVYAFIIVTTWHKLGWGKTQFHQTDHDLLCTWCIPMQISVIPTLVVWIHIISCLYQPKYPFISNKSECLSHNKQKKLIHFITAHHVFVPKSIPQWPSFAPPWHVAGASWPPRPPRSRCAARRRRPRCRSARPAAEGRRRAPPKRRPRGGKHPENRALNRVWNMNSMNSMFPFSWGISSSNWLLYFSEGYTTKQAGVGKCPILRICFTSLEKVSVRDYLNYIPNIWVLFN